MSNYDDFLWESSNISSPYLEVAGDDLKAEGTYGRRAENSLYNKQKEWIKGAASDKLFVLQGVISPGSSFISYAPRGSSLRTECAAKTTPRHIEWLDKWNIEEIKKINITITDFYNLFSFKAKDQDGKECETEFLEAVYNFNLKKIK